MLRYKLLDNATRLGADILKKLPYPFTVGIYFFNSPAAGAVHGFIDKTAFAGNEFFKIRLRHAVG